MQSAGYVPTFVPDQSTGVFMPRKHSAVGILHILALLAPAGAAAQAEARADSGWIDLFNGRDLEGWIVKITGRELGDDPARTFRVEDGVIRVAYDRYTTFDGRYGHLFYRAPFSSYTLHLEYRFTGEQVEGGADWALRNSGVMVHSQPPESMTLEQEFPVSIEFQFLGGTGTGDRPTGNLCTPGTNVVMNGRLVTRHCTSSSAPTFDGDQWVTTDIEVRADSIIRHFVDGRLVLEYSRPQYDPADSTATPLIRDDSLALREGWIALQSESHPVEFRNIRIRPEPDGTTEDTIRVVAYNIHHGEGMDERLDLERIAALIRAQQPDLVALQEIDRGTGRTGGVDQAETLGRLTGMMPVFGDFMPYRGGQYGMAVLSRWPILERRNLRLPDGEEPRTALAIRVRSPRTGHDLEFIGIHLYSTPEERLAQAQRLLDLISGDTVPVILAGDFNSTPASAVMNALDRSFDIADKGADHLTFPSENADREIDFILFRPATRFRILEHHPLDEPVASDHRPLFARMIVRPPNPRPGPSPSPSPSPTSGTTPPAAASRAAAARSSPRPAPMGARHP